jgi:hypothetical protein
MPSRLQVIALLIALPAASIGVRAQGAASGTSAAPRGGTGTISGIVYDSVAGAPLVGATVQLVRDSGDAAVVADLGHRHVYTATTDSAGAYRFRHLATGRYLATFYHPVLDTLGLEPRLRHVEVGNGPVAPVNFTVPAPQTIWALTCRPASPTDSSGLLFGYVRDAETGAPVADGEVTVHWTELLFDQMSGVHIAPRQVTVKTNDAGRYAICGLPSDGSIGVSAVSGEARSGMLALQIPARGLVRREFTISTTNTQVVLESDSAGLDSGAVLAAGTARVAGTVRSQNGEPMSDVELWVVGTEARGRTGKDGTFLLTGLPAGTYMLQTRRLGLAPARIDLTLTRGHTTRVDITVKEAIVLSTRTVYGKAHASLQMERLAGFLRRKRTGWGHYLMRGDIERRQPFNTSDLFSAMLGVRVVPGGPLGLERVVRMRGGPGELCRPNVFLDGTQVIRDEGPDVFLLDEIIPPSQIVGVEVYTERMAAPPEFQGLKCGSIVIWTRYAFPSANTEQ